MALGSGVSGSSVREPKKLIAGVNAWPQIGDHRDLILVVFGRD